MEHGEGVLDDLADVLPDLDPEPDSDPETRKYSSASAKQRALSSSSLERNLRVSGSLTSISFMDPDKSRTTTSWYDILANWRTRARSSSSISCFSNHFSMPSASFLIALFPCTLSNTLS